MAITINNLIGGSINIVTGGGGTSERWVEPQYTDDWVFSDGQKHTIRIDYTDETFDGHLAYNYYIDDVLVKGDTDAYEIEISDYDTVTAYRKYIPGHWEDADGNWINGSWSSWSDGNLYWSNSNNAYEYMMANVKDNGGTIYPDSRKDDAIIVTYPYVNFGDHSSYGVIVRTWNNTKPAPTT